MLRKCVLPLSYISIEDLPTVLPSLPRREQGIWTNVDHPDWGWMCNCRRNNCAFARLYLASKLPDEDAKLAEYLNLAEQLTLPRFDVFNMLYNHSSPSDRMLLNTLTEEKALRQLPERLRRMSLLCKPGDGSAYSQAIQAALQQLVETGMILSRDVPNNSKPEVVTFDSRGRRVELNDNLKEALLQIAEAQRER